MPRGLAIILCYLALIGFIVGFGALLLPRLSSDAARIGREAPTLYERMNNEWAPNLARWIERKFPSMAVHDAADEAQDDGLHEKLEQDEIVARAE